MSVRVKIVEGALGAAGTGLCPSDSPRGANCAIGAWLTFDGIVRVEEQGRAIIALDYEAYRPMAERMLERIAQELVAKHCLSSIEVEHSTGRVAVGECSFRLSVESAHRREAIAALGEFIDQMKRDVPIWKRAVH